MKKNRKVSHIIVAIIALLAGLVAGSLASVAFIPEPEPEVVEVVEEVNVLSDVCKEAFIMADESIDTLDNYRYLLRDSLESEHSSWTKILDGDVINGLEERTEHLNEMSEYINQYEDSLDIGAYRTAKGQCFKS